jgi:hypothetical protein
MKGEIEDKAVELAEAKAGLQLRAGHRVRIIVAGVKGSKGYGRSTRERSADASTIPTPASPSATPGSPTKTASSARACR